MYSYIYTLIYTDRDLNAIYAPLYASISLHGITSLGFEIDSMKCCNNGIEMLNMTLLLRRARVLVRQGLGFGMRSREGVCVGQGGGIAVLFSHLSTVFSGSGMANHGSTEERG